MSLGGQIGQGINDIGSGISDLIEAGGSYAEAKSFGTAASLAGQNAIIAGESGALNLYNARIQQQQQIGQASAAIAGAGLKASGSSLEVLRSSYQQAGLTNAVIQQQTAINVNSYQEQQEAYTAEEQAAKAAAEGETVSGIFSMVGGIASIA